MEKIDEKLISGLITPGQSLLVGVSGGADSMCLLTLLAGLRGKIGYKLYAIHINHGLRGAEADRDQKLVEDYCKTLKVPLEVVNVDVKNYCQSHGTTTEEGARILRYQAFKKVAKEKNIDLIAVAHNKNDQAETILMHILRGGSLRGASGMQKEWDKIIRPLLNVEREDIESYNKQNGVPYIVDSTNADISYSRNFIRNEVLPKIRQVYPNAISALVNFAKLAKSDNDYIDSLLPKELLVEGKSEVKILEGAKNLPSPLSSRLVILATQKLGVHKDVEQKHVDAVLELFNKKSGASLNLMHGLVAHRDYDGVSIEKIEQNNVIERDFGVKSLHFANFGEILVEKADNFADFTQNELVHYVDADKIPDGAVWRTFRAGDTFCPVNSHNKKLSDYYTDKKIERRKRERIPVLAKGSVVLVVAGLGISEQVKIQMSTKRAYRIKYNRE